ncbi:MAG: hypothetical protein H0U16_13270, partial [Actinobacteria bacterium]|nr:hypothetical protein [Actinomycetota bacterium]
GWATTSYNAEMALMTGAGIGVWYGDVREAGAIIQKTGGVASGPLPKMRQVNDTGRHIMSGGNRRSAIWAGLPWWHPDIFPFIVSKDYSDEIKALKAKDWSFPAPMDTTNISVTLDDDFFQCYEGAFETVSGIRGSALAPDGETWQSWAVRVYDTAIRHMLKHGEPGFTVDTGDKSGEVLRNAPVAGGTHVLTSDGYRRVVDIVDTPQTVWTGRRWAPGVVFSKTAKDAPILKVRLTGGREIRCEPNHEFLIDCWSGAGVRRRFRRTDRVKAKDLVLGDRAHLSLPFGSLLGGRDSEAYTLGYLYGDGSFTKAGGAEVSLCTDESKACLPLLSGYRSVTESDGRGYTRVYFGVSDKWSGRSKSTFPDEVFGLGDEGLSSFVAGLFDADGNWEPQQRSVRLSSVHAGFLHGVRRALEQIGIISHVSKAGHSTYGQSQTYQLVVATSDVADFAEDVPTHRVAVTAGSKSYRPSAIKVLGVEEDGHEDVYCADVNQPEHSFMAEGIIISNCTEITSADDSDVCNLGSLVLSRFDSPEQFGAALRDWVLFLTAGSVYSDVPYARVGEVRELNRRLGAGLMGVHEFIIRQGARYGSDEALEVLDPYMREYGRALEYAHDWQERLGLSLSKGATAIAPNGTIGIIAETSPSADPFFSAAESRQVKVGTPWGDTYQESIVVDPVVKRMAAEGIDPSLIEDAYELALDPERRIRQQHYLQGFTDHAIS